MLIFNLIPALVEGVILVQVYRSKERRA